MLILHRSFCTVVKVVDEVRTLGSEPKLGKEKYIVDHTTSDVFFSLYGEVMIDMNFFEGRKQLLYTLVDIIQ